MRDEWFGKRNPLTGEEYGDKDEWIDWDFALANAFQTIEASTDSNGIYFWEKDDPAGDITAKRKVDPFRNSIDRITGAKNYKPQPGEYYIPVLRSTSSKRNNELFTYEQWVEWKKEEQQKELERE